MFESNSKGIISSQTFSVCDFDLLRKNCAIHRSCYCIHMMSFKNFFNGSEREKIKSSWENFSYHEAAPRMNKINFPFTSLAKRKTIKFMHDKYMLSKTPIQELMYDV